MGLEYYSTVLNVQDLERSKNFWKEALGFVVKQDNPDWVSLRHPDKEWHLLALQLTDKPKVGLNRYHFDLVAEDGPAEVERLKGLGATIIPWEFYEPDSDFLVMADPEGNEFCVCTRDGQALEPYRVRP